jgi:aspartate racemase
LVSPTAAEQDFIHEKYMGELIHGVIRPETRAAFLAIAERMRTEDHITGLILGGTELPLILGDVKDSQIPFLDTTQLHVDAIVERMLA